MPISVKAKIEDVERDADGDRRVDPAHVIEDDEGAADDDRDGSQRIREIVQEKRADVHAALLHRISEHRSQRVDRECDTPQDDDRPALDLGRVDHPHSALIDQVEADKNKRGVVYQRRDDLDAAIAKRHALVRGPSRNLARGKGNDQRGHVGEVVQRICDQGKAAGKNSPGYLRDSENSVRPYCNGNPAIA